MRCRKRLPMLAVLALGGLLGYLAAVGKLGPSSQAAANPVQQPSAGDRSRTQALPARTEPFTALRLPKLYDLRADPYEQADVTSNTYYQWMVEQGYILFAASTVTGEFLRTFKEFPPSQRPASFTIDQAMEKLKQNLGN